jgi:hypothetical protein
MTPTTPTTTTDTDRLSVGPLPRSDQITPDFSHIDPTLDSCCRRDAEDSLKAQTKRGVLQQNDRVAAYERTRRGQDPIHNASSIQQQQQQQRNPHLVSVPLGSSSLRFFDGCRCSYDPSRDGGTDYLALAELRQQQGSNSDKDHGSAAGVGHHEIDSDSDDDLEAFMEGFGGGGAGSVTKRTSDDGDVDDDIDDDDPLLQMDDGPVSEWERQRKQQLMQQLQSLEAARQHGYGGHRPMHPTRVLKVAGLTAPNRNNAKNAAPSRIPPASVVVHLYDPDSLASASLDLYLEQALAPQYPGTMFLRSAGRVTSAVERDLLTQLANQPANSHVGRSLMQLINDPEDSFPALLVVRSGQVINVACGFHRPSQHWVDPTTGKIVPPAVEEWLDRSSAGNGDASVLCRQPPALSEICHLRPEELALLDYLRTCNNDGGRAQHEFLTAVECSSRAGVGKGEDGYEDSVYDCGMPGCRKTYHHQHVGIGDVSAGNDINPNSASSGLPSALLDDGAASADT